MCFYGVGSMICDICPAEFGSIRRENGHTSHPAHTSVSIYFPRFFFEELVLWRVPWPLFFCSEVADPSFLLLLLHCPNLCCPRSCFHFHRHHHSFELLLLFLVCKCILFSYYTLGLLVGFITEHYGICHPEQGRSIMRGEAWFVWIKEEGTERKINNRFFTIEATHFP